MVIAPDDLSHPAVQALLAAHLENMHAISPRESVHALGLEGLRRPGVSFFAAWDGGELVGVGAIKELTATHGEVKSMRTADSARRRGVGRAVLAHIVGVARSRGHTRLSLETGAGEPFRPARRLYEGAGFRYCEPFADYAEDPNSVFLTLELTDPGGAGGRR